MSLPDSIAVRPVAEALQHVQVGKGYWTRVRERLLADRITMTVTALLGCIIVMVLAAPLIATHDPAAGSVFARLKSPGYHGHWLGTDEVGRDLWSRILYGGRLSLLCGVAPVAFALLLGGSLGLLAGYLGDDVDEHAAAPEALGRQRRHEFHRPDLENVSPDETAHDTHRDERERDDRQDQVPGVLPGRREAFRPHALAR